METTYEYGAQQTAEPFWQRIQKFFLLPLDRAVLLRIGGMSAALVVSLVLLLFGAFGFVLLGAVVCTLAAGAATASRSSSARRRAI
jgi:hypothetical protein